MRLDADLAGRLAVDEQLWRDFNDICDCGGRLSGTESEKRAFALLRERVRAASPANSGRSIPVPYGGWRAKSATLKLADGSFAACHPLVRTIATDANGFTAEVIDIGALTLAGGSELTLAATGAAQHRLRLAHGRLSARVTETVVRRSSPVVG